MNNSQGFGGSPIGWYMSAPERSWWWRFYRWGQGNRPFMSNVEAHPAPADEAPTPAPTPAPVKKLEPPTNPPKAIHNSYIPYHAGYGPFRGRRSSILLEALEPSSNRS